MFFFSGDLTGDLQSRKNAIFWWPLVTSKNALFTTFWWPLVTSKKVQKFDFTILLAWLPYNMQWKRSSLGMFFITWNTHSPTVIHSEKKSNFRQKLPFFCLTGKSWIICTVGSFHSPQILKQDLFFGLFSKQTTKSLQWSIMNFKVN